MANIKFSEFTAETAIAANLFVVGYDGSTNKRILATDLLGNYLPLAGGTMTGNTIHGTNVKSLWGTMQVYNDGTHNNFLILGGDVRYNNFGQGDDISFTLTSPAGTSANYLTLSGQDERIEVNKDMLFGQNDKAIFNSSLEIYSTNTGASFIKDTSTSFLTIQSGADLKLQTSGGEDYIICNENSSVELYFNNIRRLETTSTGANITDTLGILGDFTNPGLLKLYAPILSNYVGIKGPLDAGTSYDLQLPNTLPNVANQILESNATGTLSWIATPSGGGGGATDLNGLSDVLIDGTSAYFINIPSNLSGNPTDNLVIGDNAGNSLTTGKRNVILGSQAAPDTTSGSYQVIIGYNAGLNTTTNGESVLIGYDAGKLVNASGSVIIGAKAARNLSGAYSQHTIVGVNACNQTSSGNYHCAFGAYALFLQTTGARQTAIGYRSLFSLSTANDNTALGYYSGYAITGSGNTVIGSNSGYAGGTNNLTSGSNNILIGHNSAASAATVDNEITLGNSSISTLRCAVTSITSLSDQRDKSNIKDLSYGLDFIDSLQPREFIWDNRAETKLQQVKDENGDDVLDENNDNVFEEVEFYSDNKGKKDFGFIAQEVQILDDDTLRLVYDKNPEKLEISYGKLLPILVKAIQELKAEIDILKS